MNESPDIRPELSELLAHLDGEATADERRSVQARFDADPGLRDQLEALDAEFGVIGALVRGEIEAESGAVHEARFEQIWDAVERELDREAAAVAAPASASDAATGSLWSRLAARLRPAAIPLGLASAGVAAAVVIMVTSGPGAGTVAQGDESDSDPVGESAPKGETSPDVRLAENVPPPESLPAPLPAPESNEAEVERIEFGGASGRISKIEGVRGTTTVIWIEEDEDTDDGEQSL